MPELLLDKKKRYLIAVSGGPDSMALFDMARECDVYLEAAHVNYHMRQSAQRDEKIVRDYCRKNGIVFHVAGFDKELYSGNFQDSARKFRYGFFADLCAQRKLDEVLVAHQEDDLIETYLMQKERKLGVSYYGLRERNEISGARVYRPLLEYSKEELLSYCVMKGIPYGIDESNLKQDYQRNRIRHRKVSKMSPEERKKILLEIREKNRKKQLHLQKVSGILKKGEFSISRFASIPYLADYLSIEFPSSSKRFRKEIRRQLLVADSCFFEGERLCFSREYGKIYVFEKRNGYAYVFENMEQMKDFSCEYFALKEKGETIEGVFLSEEDFPVIIRNAHPSDQIRMRFGTKKVSRFFIDRKMKREQRMLWPLMENRNGEIVFVAGLGCDINHYCRNSGIFMIKC